MAARRSPTSRTSALPSRAPARISARMAAGSSPRGLSSVTTRTSASRAAISPMIGRLPWSRSPPAPSTTISRPAVSGRSASSAAVDRVGLVGVVDDDGEVLAGVDALEPAGHAAALGHRAGDRLEVEPQPGAGRERGQRVGHVEVTGQRAARLDAHAARAGDHERGPARRHLRRPRPASRRRAPVAENDCSGTPPRCEQPPAVLVVGVDQSAAAPLGGEQGGLGLEVVLEVAVEVEVVAAEVGEHGDVEDHAVDAALHQGVAGDLHRAGGRPSAPSSSRTGRAGRGPRAWSARS